MGPRLALPLAAGVAAALQIARASRWEAGTDHLGAVALGWAGAIYVTWQERARGEPGAGRAFGLAIWAAAVAATLTGWEAYRTADRLLPLAAGLGLALAASGIRGLRQHAKALVLLGLPLLLPLPRAVRLAVLPVRQTAALAEGFLHLGGVPVERQGTVLFLTDGSLEVFEPCSGMGAIAQVLALAVFALCLFPATRSRAAMVLVSAIAIGFASNAGRVAFLAVIASRTPDDFAYWEGYGTGSTLFPAMAAGLAVLAWGAILLVPGGARPARGAMAAAPSD